MTVMKEEIGVEVPYEYSFVGFLYGVTRGRNMGDKVIFAQNVIECRKAEELIFGVCI